MCYNSGVFLRKATQIEVGWWNTAQNRDWISTIVGGEFHKCTVTDTPFVEPEMLKEDNNNLLAAMYLARGSAGTAADAESQYRLTDERVADMLQHLKLNLQRIDELIGMSN